MRRRIMVDGKPAWTDDGPAFARRQGYGGSAMGYFGGTRLAAPTIRSAAQIAGQKRRQAAKLQRKATS